jgi:hypothetical protein
MTDFLTKLFEYATKHYEAILTTVIVGVLAVVTALIHRYSRPNIQYHGFDDVGGAVPRYRFLIKNYEPLDEKGPFIVEMDADDVISAKVCAGPWAASTPIEIKDNKVLRFIFHGMPAEGVFTIEVKTRSSIPPNIRMASDSTLRPREFVEAKPWRWFPYFLKRWFVGLALYWALVLTVIAATSSTFTDIDVSLAALSSGISIFVFRMMVPVKGKDTAQGYRRANARWPTIEPSTALRDQPTM